MTQASAALADRLRARFPDTGVTVDSPRGEVGVVFDAAMWHDGCRALRDEFGFEQLIDVCGVDYSTYGNQLNAPPGAACVKPIGDGTCRGDSRGRRRGASASASRRAGR